MLNPKVQEILDQRRQEAITRLQHAFAGDHIPVDELERRLSEVESASTLSALEAVVADLPRVEGSALGTTTRDDAPVRMFALLGGAVRRGAFEVPREMAVDAFWGGATLDLSEAHFGEGEYRLRVRAVMGGVEVYVPTHVSVDCVGSGVLGGFSNRAATVSEPRAVLRIEGLALLGGVEVRNPRRWRDRLAELRLLAESHLAGHGRHGGRQRRRHRRRRG